MVIVNNFKQTTGSQFSIQQCEACHKGFTGFMKQALRCVGKLANLIKLALAAGTYKNNAYLLLCVID